MALQLRFIVTGMGNSGRSVINAIVGQELLPAMAEGDHAILTRVVPQQVEDGALPVLQAFHVDEAGHSQSQFAANGEKEIRDRLRELQVEAPRHETARVECRISALLRDSLNVFSPPAAEWSDTQFIDIGRPSGWQSAGAQACVDLTCRMSQRLIICAPFDQVDTDAMVCFLREIRDWAPYHFDDALCAEPRLCPLIFVITEVDRAGGVASAELEERLRATLREVASEFGFQAGFAVQSPVFCVSADDVLRSGQASHDWERFEALLTTLAGCKRDVVCGMASRRAACMIDPLRGSLELVRGQWPHHASSLWQDRSALALRVGLSVCAVGTPFVAAAYLAAASTAVWFGVGGYQAAAAAAAANAQAAAVVATGAASAATGFGIATTIAGISTLAVGASAVYNEQGSALPDGVLDVGGTLVAHASTVGAQTVRECFAGLDFGVGAAEIKDGAAYRDVLFYPDDAIKCAGAFGSFPVVLHNRKHGSNLSVDKGGSVTCLAPGRSGQLWWARPGGDGRISLQNAITGRYLRAGVGSLPLNPRLAVQSSEEIVEEWSVFACDPGVIRLQHCPTAQYLFFDGIVAGCYAQKYPDQEWIVVPKIPMYIGEFVRETMHGSGQLFSPSGAPLFRGRMEDGRPAAGFVLDERSVCLGHFTFSDGVQHSDQPEDVAGSQLCACCRVHRGIAAEGRALRPCGHGVVCETCAAALCSGGGVCPLCRAAAEGVMVAT
eukprot:CAMPEP_0176019234 /NCGR_PEP_ID=MMETSP0120_2-20121206/9285_1 /TAXON_ID=160619 /ORGANISM="Kryptoperidinium foliaceum, Strain CCMP 1326" /LENGTH=722 /DNA_ID=CAMNT_0017352303 /DNA_START=24 /DNA_END=2192 /DNA_ORIENTATION=+